MGVFHFKMFLFFAMELGICRITGGEINDTVSENNLTAKIDSLLAVVKKLEDRLNRNPNPELLSDSMYHFRREKSLLMEIAQTQSLLFHEVHEQAKKQSDIFDEILQQTKDGTDAMDDFRSKLEQQTKLLKFIEKDGMNKKRRRNKILMNWTC